MFGFFRSHVLCIHKTTNNSRSCCFQLLGKVKLSDEVLYAYNDYVTWLHFSRISETVHDRRQNYCYWHLRSLVCAFHWYRNWWPWMTLNCVIARQKLHNKNNVRSAQWTTGVSCIRTSYVYSVHRLQTAVDLVELFWWYVVRRQNFPDWTSSEYDGTLNCDEW